MASYAITGASRGIGFAFVKQLSSSNSNTVFALVRNPDSASGLKELAASKSNVHIIVADVTSPEQLKAAASQISSITGGSLDVLIENAAYIDDQATGISLLDLIDNPAGIASFQASLDKSITDNVMSVIHTTSAMLDLVKNSKLKKIIVLSTGLADVESTIKWEFPAHIPYSISKQAVNMLVAKYAIQTKTDGVTIVAISPGLVNTATKAPTPEEIEGYKAIVKNFQKTSPSFQGAITPQESVEKMLNVIGDLSVKDSGRFLSHHGNQEWL